MPAAIASLPKNSIDQRVRELGISCTSMAVTVFGDVVSQHGGHIWLGSLIRALEPLGFSERSVRTAAYRLVQNDWLEVERVGRRSYYAFTAQARGHYERAARRIYAPEPGDWDGNWTLVAPVAVPDEQRDAFRKSLLWQGFNTLVPGLYAHPSSNRSSLDSSLQELGLAGQVIVFSARAEDEFALTALKDLVSDRWRLEELRDLYRSFLDYWQIWARRLGQRRPQPDESLHLRLLLIHEYRRILLRDADLPKAMLPPNWEGFRAQRLMGDLYRHLAGPSVAFLKGRFENAHGSLRAPQGTFYRRLGGLPHVESELKEVSAR